MLNMADKSGKGKLFLLIGIIIIAIVIYIILRNPSVADSLKSMFGL